MGTHSLLVVVDRSLLSLRVYLSSFSTHKPETMADKPDVAEVASFDKSKLKKTNEREEHSSDERNDRARKDGMMTATCRCINYHCKLLNQSLKLFGDNRQDKTVDDKTAHRHGITAKTELNDAIFFVAEEVVSLTRRIHTNIGK